MDYQKVVDRLTRSMPDRGKLEAIGKAATIGLATYIVTKKLYDAYLGPLYHVPSPFYAKFFTISKASLNKPFGTIYAKYMTFNDKYGSVVKLGPSSLLISDKTMLKQVLQQEDLEKGPMYDLLKRDGAASLLITRDKGMHKRLRLLISPAFSLEYLDSLEEHILNVLNNMMLKIDGLTTEHPQEGADVDIWKLLQHNALDIIGDCAFGKSFDTIKSDYHPVTDSIMAELRWASWIIAHPFLTKLLTLGQPVNMNPIIKEFMANSINARIQSGERRNDILQILLDTQESEDPEDRLSDIAIMNEAVMFLIAGSETISNTLGFAVIELLRHPHAMKKLQEEIDGLDFADQHRQLFCHAQLKQLPYLDAVLNETMRMNPVPAAGLERIAEKDFTLAGKLHVPKGTKLICNVYHAQMDENYWPNACSFEPERWLLGNETRRDLEAFFPFGIGSRNCIGENFAWMQMRLVLATLIRRFDLTPLAMEMQQAKEVRHFITITILNNSFSVVAHPRQQAN